MNSIILIVDVAPVRSFRVRRDAVSRILESSIGGGGERPLVYRGVCFTLNEVHLVLPEISEAGDSITASE